MNEFIEFVRSTEFAQVLVFLLIWLSLTNRIEIEENSGCLDIIMFIIFWIIRLLAYVALTRVVADFYFSLLGW